MRYLVPVKGYSLRIVSEQCANPAIQGGDRLYDKDHRTVGTIGGHYGQPVGRWRIDPDFQDDVGLLIVDGDIIDEFKHSILNLKVHFFNLDAVRAT
jgi:hypothetical protein